LLYAGHSFRGVALRMDHELTGSACGPSGIYFSLGHPHIVTVTQWQKSSFTREPPKTKAELRRMLTEAVRNTQPSAENGSKRPKAKNDRG
jgi:hypothetical protein